MAPSQLPDNGIPAVAELVADLDGVITAFHVVLPIFLVFGHDGCGVGGVGAVGHLDRFARAGYLSTECGVGAGGLEWRVADWFDRMISREIRRRMIRQSVRLLLSLLVESVPELESTEVRRIVAL